MSNSINITVKWKFRDGKSLPPTAMKNYLTYTEKQVIDRHFCRDVFSNYVSSFDNQDRITKSLSSIVEERARHSCNTLEEITNDVLNTYDMGTKGLFSKVDAKIQALKEHLLDCKSIIWIPIISMKEKDAEAIGLDNEIEWMKYTRELIPKLSEILMIPENNLNYLAAFHEKHPSQQNSKSDAGLQPHVHLIIWEQEPLKERPVIHESLFKEMRQIIKEHFLTTVANKGLVHNELVVESSHDISLDTEIEESLLTNEPDKELPVEVINSMSSNPLLLLERYHKEIVEMASKHLNQEIAFDLQKTDRLQHFLASGGISNKEVDEYKMYQQKDVLELAIKLASLPPSIDIHSLELLNKTIDKMESIVNSPINKEGNISKELAIKPSGELIKTQPQLTIKKAKAILPILYDIKENLDIRIANIPCLPLYKEGEKAIRILESNPIIVDQKIGDLKKDIQATIEKQYLPLLVDTANSLKENHIISTSNELKEERQQKTIPFDFIHPLSLDKSILEHINSISQSINSASFDACSSIAYYLNDNYFKHHFKECERHILQQASEIEIILYVRNLIKELDQRHQAKELDL